VSADQEVEEFLRNPRLELLRNKPSLLDRVGENLGRRWAKRELPEHQLRQIHERLLELYYESKNKRLRDASRNWDEGLDLELSRLKYFMVYQRSRMKGDTGRFYFEPFIRLVDQVRDYTSLEMLFYLSESVIAYYNYWEERLGRQRGEE
jgi:CRISPR/Cas system CSM-associated protein Csm2 small subunit